MKLFIMTAIHKAMHKQHIHCLRCLPLLLLLVVGGCAVNPVTGDQDLVLMSEEQEIALGRKSSVQVMQQYHPYENEALQAYVQQVGERVAQNSHRNDLIYRFTLLDSREVNAFALPGGYIYITRGLLAYLNSEAELAAVLGHEIGHVTARHSVRQQSAAQMASIGATLGSILLPGMQSQAASSLVDTLGTALLRGYGRDHELEADRLGAEYLARSGYDSNAMLDVIRVLKNQELFDQELAREEGREARAYHGVFSTHPDNDKRLQEVIAYAEKYKSSTPPVESHDEFVGKLDGLVFGDSSRDGIIRDSHFFHHDLGIGFEFPHGWSLKNLPDSLVAIAPGNAAILQITLQDLNQRVSPKDFMRTRLGLDQLTEGQSFTIQGLEAYTAIAPVKTQFGQRKARFTVVYYNQQAYIFAGVSEKETQSASFDQDFLQTARSFHPLTSIEREQARPVRLQIIQSTAQSNFTELAKTSPLATQAASQLRLLNDLYPNGEPAAGSLIKIVR